MIVAPFPSPPDPVLEALTILAVLRSGDQKRIGELGDRKNPPRPWAPASCQGELRAHVWRWCDEIASWINREYIWRPTGMVPSCWPWHPHIAHELPVLGCLRLDAEDAHSPELLEDWHRSVLPLFLDRIATRLGEGGCRSGKHADWPAASRYQADCDPVAVAERQQQFATDCSAADARPPPRPAATYTPTQGTEK